MALWLMVLLVVVLMLLVVGVGMVDTVDVAVVSDGCCWLWMIVVGIVGVGAVG
jgi:hypothetical protein